MGGLVVSKNQIDKKGKLKSYKSKNHAAECRKWAEKKAGMDGIIPEVGGKFSGIGGIISEVSRNLSEMELEKEWGRKII